MIERDDHHIVEPAEIGTVGPGRGPRTGDEGAAMAPEQDRPFRSLATRGPDVQIETVLVELLLPGEREETQQVIGERKDVLALHGHVAVLECIANAGPGLGPARRPEAQIAERRHGIGNPLEDLDATVACAADPSGGGLDDDFRCHVLQSSANGRPGAVIGPNQFRMAECQTFTGRHEPPDILIDLPSRIGWP